MKRKTQVKNVVSQVKFVESGSAHALAYDLNEHLSSGWEVVEFGQHQNEFFQSHSAWLVRTTKARKFIQNSKSKNFVQGGDIL